MFFGEICNSIRGKIDCRQKIKPKSDRLLEGRWPATSPEWVSLARHAGTAMTAGLSSTADAPSQRSELAKSAHNRALSKRSKEPPPSSMQTLSARARVSEGGTRSGLEP